MLKDSIRSVSNPNLLKLDKAELDALSLQAKEIYKDKSILSNYQRGMIYSYHLRNEVDIELFSIVFMLCSLLSPLYSVPALILTGVLYLGYSKFIGNIMKKNEDRLIILGLVTALGVGYVLMKGVVFMRYPILGIIGIGVNIGFAVFQYRRIGTEIETLLHRAGR